MTMLPIGCYILAGLILLAALLRVTGWTIQIDGGGVGIMRPERRPKPAALPTDAEIVQARNHYVDLMLASHRAEVACRDTGDTDLIMASFKASNAASAAFRALVKLTA